MSGESFTPGPWRFEHTNQMKQSYVAVSVDEFANGGTVVIGQCAGPDRHANARLIAAAPDLLAALKTIKHSIQQARIPGNDWKRELALIENTVDAAIAKAKGETA